MTAISAEIGVPRRQREPALRTFARSADFGEILQQSIDADRGMTNQTSFAAALGWPEETLRNYLASKSTPNVERLLLTIRANRMPAALHLAVLLLLADGRYIVSAPVPDVVGDDEPFRDQASTLRARVRELQAADLKLSERVDAALESGRITADNLASIQTQGHAARRALDVVLAIAAAMFRRGRGVR